ncbi:hypothetical protein lerEdw1_014975 [Lerista edwardsae]|nr:hypothetical protein lerEdw1_014975 [Lerista edwardsae]
MGFFFKSGFLYPTLASLQKDEEYGVIPWRRVSGTILIEILPARKGLHTPPIPSAAIVSSYIVYPQCFFLKNQNAGGLDNNTRLHCRSVVCTLLLSHPSPGTMGLNSNVSLAFSAAQTPPNNYSVFALLG